MHESVFKRSCLDLLLYVGRREQHVLNVKNVFLHGVTCHMVDVAIELTAD